MQKRWGTTAFGTQVYMAIFFFFAIKKCTKGENEALEPGFQERETFRIE